MAVDVETSTGDRASVARDAGGLRRLKLTGLIRLVSAVTQRFELDDHERSWGPSKVKRVGVPGGLQLNTRQTLKFVFRWRGTAFKAAMKSWAALAHCAVFVSMWQLATFAQQSLLSERSIEVYLIEAEVISAFAFVLAFVLAQYIEFVVHRYNERLSVCIDAGEAALQVALEASVMMRGNKDVATRLVRYMQLIMHLYYLTIDGPMSQAKWELCLQRGIVEPSELQTLAEADGSVSAEPVVVCVWALEIVHTLFLERKLSSDHAVRMETEISSARRLASRQRDLHEVGSAACFHQEHSRASHLFHHRGTLMFTSFMSFMSFMLMFTFVFKSVHDVCSTHVDPRVSSADGATYAILPPHDNHGSRLLGRR